MPCSIRNPNTEPVTLPFPLKGVLNRGQGVMLNLTKADLLALLGGAAFTGGLDIRDEPDYVGSFDNYHTAVFAEVPYLSSDNIFAGAASFLGDVRISLIDSSATPGAATIDRRAGQVSIAPGAASVVVTNSTVTAASLVFAVIQQADATLTTLLRVVPAAGSFTITGNANATAACKVAFLVINPAV